MDYFDSFDCQMQCEDFFDGTTYYLDEYYRDFSDEQDMQFTANFDTPMSQFLDEF